MGQIEFTKQAIIHVDATPDEDYPLRILKAYRQNSNITAASSSDGKTTPLLDAMNKDQEKRAAILDKAIAKLEYWIPEKEDLPK